MFTLLAAAMTIDIDAQNPVNTLQLTGVQGIDIVLDTTPYAVNAMAARVGIG